MQLLTVSSQIRNPLTTGGRITDVFLELWAVIVVAVRRRGRGLLPGADALPASAREDVLDGRGIESPRSEQDVAVEPRSATSSSTRLSDSPNAATAASTPSSPTFRAHAATPWLSKPAMYEPLGRSFARSATTRHSHGAKHDTAFV